MQSYKLLQFAVVKRAISKFENPVKNRIIQITKKMFLIGFNIVNIEEKLGFVKSTTNFQLCAGHKISLI